MGANFAKEFADGRFGADFGGRLERRLLGRSQPLAGGAYFSGKQSLGERITLARPRDVSAPDFNEVRRRLTQKLTSHVARRELPTAA